MPKQRYLIYLSFCCLYINLQTPKVAPLHLVGSTRSLFFLITGFCNAKFWGLRDRLRGHVGSRRILFHASLIHFVVSFLSQLKHILVLADQSAYASTFECVWLCSEGKINLNRSLRRLQHCKIIINDKKTTLDEFKGKCVMANLQQ